MSDNNKYDINLKDNMSNTGVNTYKSFVDNFRNDLDLSEHYIGEVVDNNDPEKIGRCKIIVFGAFSEHTSPDNLPWAVPEFSFIGSNRGSFIVPPIGAYVNVYFADGEIAFPVYSSKALNVKQLPTNKDKNYPNNMIFFETDNGDSFEIDRETSETKFIHNTGSTITIDKDGTITIDSVNKLNMTHDKGLFIDGSYTKPEGVGPICALPTCLFTGTAHTARHMKPFGYKKDDDISFDTQFDNSTEDL